ncbi:hypothetical protein A1S_3814 [Acinetobacter baumannii ATCC 17978]|nr:hypothetical protein A1S_3814 [Acinetobacter baumannii ATCC 17978]
MATTVRKGVDAVVEYNLETEVNNYVSGILEG